jgi:alanine-glyoxylate transaminase/serine-glyoxylate transaminase/serine-pyruvate transaminase
LASAWTQTADADELRKIILENFNMSLGNGLGRLQRRLSALAIWAIFNDLMLPEH